MSALACVAGFALLLFGAAVAGATRSVREGMLLQAARKWDLDLAASYIVGDRWRDIEAGQRAGCRTIFVDYGYDEKQPEQYDHRVASLWEAADIICSG